jgi:hypothetical protein
MNFEKRSVMFSMIFPIEFDLKRNLLKLGVEFKFSDDMIKQIEFKTHSSFHDIQSNKVKLDNLGIKDFQDLVNIHKNDLKLNKNDLKIFNKTIESLIPIRNNVVHSKPIEINQYSDLCDIFFLEIPKLSFFDWEKSNEIRLKFLNNDNTAIVQWKYIPEYDSRTINNLPMPDFDDTGFIGRKKELKEIISYIYDSRPQYQIVSIIGAGGTGKTATLLKALNIIKDSEENPFDYIVWTSLKTQKLSRGEFKKINNVITTLEGIVAQSKYVLNLEDENYLELLNKMKKHKMLLIVDNYETVTDELVLNQFFKNIPRNSKIILTSRHGLGQLDNILDFGPMEQDDAVEYYRELAKFFSLDAEHKCSNREIVDKCLKLNFNPLSIKWFLSNVYNGADANYIINNQDDLLEYCLKNVYNKLSDRARIILNILQIERKPLTKGEIIFLGDFDNISCEINELLRTYMVGREENSFVLSDMSLKYLSRNFTPTNDEFFSVKKRRKTLSGIKQNISIRKEIDPFDPFSLQINSLDIDEIIAAFYLQKVLKTDYQARKNYDVVDNYLEKAKKIKSDYYEIYKVQAVVNSKRNVYLSNESYIAAIENAPSLEHKAYVLYFYSVFIAMSDLDLNEAYEMIQEVERILGKSFEVGLAKARVLLYSGKYQECENVIEDLYLKKNNLKNTIQQNKLLKIYADLCRRQAESLDYREIEKRNAYIHKGIELIREASDKDNKLLIALVHLLKNLATNSNKVEIDYLIEILDEYYIYIVKDSNYNQIVRNINSNKDRIQPQQIMTLKKYMVDYKELVKAIFHDKYGIVTRITSKGGILSNRNNEVIIFNKMDYPNQNPILGDYVKFEPYHDNNGKLNAKNIIYISNWRLDNDSIK